MVKFNIIGAGVVGGILLIATAWFVTIQRDRGNMGDTDAVYIWAVVMGIIGFVTGGFIGGSFEKFKHCGIQKDEAEDEAEDEDEDEDDDEAEDEVVCRDC